MAIFLFDAGMPVQRQQSGLVPSDRSLDTTRADDDFSINGHNSGRAMSKIACEHCPLRQFELFTAFTRDELAFMRGGIDPGAPHRRPLI
ncbi:MAG: hypothetical protein LAT81_00230 [Oceanicaulis sp.]|nr:hypothetical protein [Oceanicaulis sp.]